MQIDSQSRFSVKLTDPKPRILIAEARYYAAISDALLEGAERSLAAAGAVYEIVSMPGALEIPLAIAAAHRSSQFEGYVALGCVIRGETTHYDIVAEQSCRALTDLGITHGLAIGNGILTVENEAQAYERASKDKHDRGGAAVEACLALIAWKRKLAKVIP